LVLLRDPQIDTLVSTLSLRETARHGMDLDRCNLTIVMDRVKAQKGGLFRKGLDVIMRATTDCFVVGAGNTLVRDRLSLLEGKRVIMVAQRITDPDLQAHLQKGNDGVTTGWHEGEIRILLVSNRNQVNSFACSTQTLANLNTNPKRRTNALMYAIAAAYGLGLSVEQIKSALANAPKAVPSAS